MRLELGRDGADRVAETSQKQCERMFTLVLNLVVVAGKLVAGLLAGSLSVISDAIHKATDSLNNINC